MDQKLYLALLHQLGLTQKNLRDIFENKKLSPEEFYNTLSAELLLPHISNAKRIQEVLDRKSKQDKDGITQILRKYNVKLITRDEPEYPESLKHIPHTPYLLYVRGNIPKGDMFGVVGSRKITNYGKKVIERIIPEIASVFPIVSGGAAGCDAMAHVTAIKSGNITVAVIGTGIDQHYPVTHEKIFQEIVDTGGAVISIFSVGEPGNPYNFPVRNEIVAGLSRGILVVEAAQRSGSLITASLALDLGKDVFAIPGDITHQNSAGTNHLLTQGIAKCTTSASDILDEYDIAVKRAVHSASNPELDTIERQIFDALSQQELDVDTLGKVLEISPSLLLTKLSLLELKHIVQKNLNGTYSLK